MKPPRFEYLKAGSLAEALEALASSEEARVLAGGQSLVPMMNLRLARPELLVDVNGLHELDAVTSRDGRVALGALCRHRRLERASEVASSVPLFRDAASLIGHPQIRNRGTLGGSLAHADPSSELAAALLALDGSVVVASAGRTPREIRASALFAGYFATTLEPGEMIVEVLVPAPASGEGAAIREFAPRHGDFAVAGSAAALRVADGSITHARAAAFGVGSRVVDLTDAIAVVVGASELTDDLLRAVASAAAAACEPMDDIHASAEDRRELVGQLTVDVVRSALDRARKGTR